MLKTLRIKFIAIIMSIVTVIMALSFAAICAAKYQGDSAVVYAALSDAAQSACAPRDTAFSKTFTYFSIEGTQGIFERSMTTVGPIALDDSKKQPSSSNSSGFVLPLTQNDKDSSDKRSSNKDKDAAALIPIAVYEITPEGSFDLMVGETTATLQSAVVETAIQRVINTSDERGTLSDLGLTFCQVTQTSTNNVYVAFTDASYADNWKSLAFLLTLVGIGMLAVLFVVCLFLSRWALRPVEEAWAAQRQFVADASHDLKTPITVILANMSILMQSADHTIASESQWIENTKTEAETMQNLVNEMLELAQVESPQQADLITEDVDVSDMVNGATLAFDVMSLEKGCTFECDVQDGIHVTGDPSQLDKMVRTLLENAFKYVNEGGKVSAKLHTQGKNVKLEIANTGQTISAEDLPHIFDRFYRADKARTSGKGGFGLGLAISREVARSHGGEITCSSDDVNGTVFQVTLPLR